jgi:hypothetical protein
MVFRSSKGSFSLVTDYAKLLVAGVASLLLGA